MCVCECVREREIVCVCVCVRERERMCVCVYLMCVIVPRHTCGASAAVRPSV